MGKLSRFAPEIKEEGAELIDATGLVVAPGLVDIHVHSVNLVKPTRRTSILGH